MYDVVYFVKESPDNEELRYSLRSLVNFPHHNVWIYGCCPKGIKPDKYIPVIQQEENKWKNVRKMITMCANNTHITDNFWLFNDDFFVMKKVKSPKIYYDGDLYKRIVEIEDKFGEMTPYTLILRKCAKELESLGLTSKNFETHTPFLVNKKKVLELNNISYEYGFRTIYSNYYKVPALEHRDVKIVSLTKQYKTGEYLSTDDKSFLGEVGNQIRKQFPNKYKYEK